jgi:molybdopterin-guanine dinucleotide biosynthesis protein A
LEAVSSVVDQKIVVVSSRAQAENYGRVLGSDASVFVDVGDVHSPLVGALTGFKEARGQYTVLLPCDVPLVSRDVVSFLFELCVGRNAVIPRWPNGYVEPLQAVYRTKPAYEAAKSSLSGGEFDVRSMVDKLSGVRYVSTLVLQQLDPELGTFFNVNTPLELKKAKTILCARGRN